MEKYIICRRVKNDNPFLNSKYGCPRDVFSPLGIFCFTPTLSNGITLHLFSSGGSGGSSSGLAVAVSIKTSIFSAAPFCISLGMCIDVRIGVEGKSGAVMAQHAGQGLFTSTPMERAIVAKVWRRLWKRTRSSIPASANARMFEEEYENVVGELQREMGDEAYLNYLDKISAHETHQGYFSIDKKKDKKARFVESKVDRKTQTSDDADAYDLIMKDEERLLSLDESVRFIFSHSALREGRDSPNVFQICPLKPQSALEIKSRQEIGRGLRLCVNQQGERMDESVLGSEVQELNKLPLVTDMTFGKFAGQLDINEKVALYVKLPKSFFISTPAGKYSPDWAIVFHEGTVKHVCFVAGTKGSNDTMELRGVEEAKMECAKAHFAAISNSSITYDVIKNFDQLICLVS